MPDGLTHYWSPAVEELGLTPTARDAVRSPEATGAAPASPAPRRPTPVVQSPRSSILIHRRFLGQHEGQRASKDKDGRCEGESATGLIGRLPAGTKAGLMALRPSPKKNDYWDIEVANSRRCRFSGTYSRKSCQTLQPIGETPISRLRSRQAADVPGRSSGQEDRHPDPVMARKAVQRRSLPAAADLKRADVDLRSPRCRFFGIDKPIARRNNSTVYLASDRRECIKMLPMPRS